MVHCDLSEDELVRRKQLSDRTRKMICGILNVVAEDDTSIMTTYRDFYLQISFSVLHPLMVFCMAKPLEGSMVTLNKRSNEMNLRSVLGSHFVNEDFGCYNYRATHWLDTDMNQHRFSRFSTDAVTKLSEDICSLQAECCNSPDSLV